MTPPDPCLNPSAAVELVVKTQPDAEHFRRMLPVVCYNTGGVYHAPRELPRGGRDVI